MVYTDHLQTELFNLLQTLSWTKGCEKVYHNSPFRGFSFFWSFESLVGLPEHCLSLQWNHQKFKTAQRLVQLAIFIFKRLNNFVLSFVQSVSLFDCIHFSASQPRKSLSNLVCRFPRNFISWIKYLLHKYFKIFRKKNSRLDELQRTSRSMS